MKTLLSIVLVLGVISYFGYLFFVQDGTVTVHSEDDAFSIAAPKLLEKNVPKVTEVETNEPFETTGVVKAIEDGKIFLESKTEEVFVPTEELTLQVGDEIIIKGKHPLLED